MDGFKFALGAMAAIARERRAREALLAGISAYLRFLGENGEK